MKIKKPFAALGALALCAVFTACGATAAMDGMSGSTADSTAGSAAMEEDSMTAAGVTKITAEEGKKMLDAGGVTLVDVRTAEEYAEKHIEGALLVPNEEIGDTMPALLPDQNATILVYCRSGRRSAEAAAKLAKLGYTKLYDMGGIKDWPYETVAGAFDANAAGTADSGAANAMAEKTKEGTLASFAATTLDGKSVDESLFSGYDLTMVNVWATYCGPCLREMPELGELSGEYADKGVQIVGIVSDLQPNQDWGFSEKALANASALVQQTGASYIHLLPSQDLYTALLGDVYAVPTTVFVDKDGKVVGDPVVGGHSKADWVKIIESHLSEVKTA